MLIKQIKQLLSPPCLLCGSLDGKTHNYCPTCYQDLPHSVNNCFLCALPLEVSASDSFGLCVTCQQARLDNPTYLGGLHHCLAAMYYLPPVSGLMQRFKNQGRKDCGHLLSHCLSLYIPTQLSHQQAMNKEWAWPDALVPMPLHPKKMRQRGFNQSHYIAKKISKHLQIKIDNKLCWRQYDTPSQQGKRRYQRQHNLNNAFIAKPLTYPAKHLVIIDDVITTGASVSHLALALQQAQPYPVMISAWCVARTLPPKNAL